MFIDCPNDLIAEYRTLDEVLPYKQYQSGARDEQKPVYQDKNFSSSNPILALEFDIVNNDGYGIKKGFYEIAVDSDYSYMMFVQSGRTVAKIPIIKQEIIDEYGGNFEWDSDNDKNVNSASKPVDKEITVNSKLKYEKKLSERERKKRQKKYKKGEDPLKHFHSSVKLEYESELDLYKIIWEKYNTRLIGIIKIK